MLHRNMSLAQGSRHFTASVLNPKFVTSRVKLKANFGFESTLANY